MYYFTSRCVCLCQYSHGIYFALLLMPLYRPTLKLLGWPQRISQMFQFPTNPQRDKLIPYIQFNSLSRWSGKMSHHQALGNSLEYEIVKSKVKSILLSSEYAAPCYDSMIPLLCFYVLNKSNGRFISNLFAYAST